MDEILFKNLSLLNQVILECTSITNEREIVKRFVDTAIKILKADYGYAFFRDEKTKEFKLLYKDVNTPFEPKIPRKKGATQKTFSSRTPLFIMSAPKTGWLRNDAKKNMGGVVVIPISYNNNNYGIFDICYFKEHKFNRTEKIICSYLGNSAAQAIAINRLYNSQKKFNKRLEREVEERTREIKEDKVKDEALLSSIGEGIIAVDTDGRIFMANPQAEEILKVRKEDLLGRSVFDTIPLLDERGKNIDKKDRPIYVTLTRHKRIKTSNFQILRKDGKRIPVSLTVTPFFLEGKLIGVIQIFHDIIKEKEIDRAKSELISLASHQLRTPLSAINWYTEALIKNELGKVNPKQRKYLQEISNANQKMIELVYDFLNVSRIELGTFVVQPSDFNAIEVAKGTLKELQPLIRRKRIKVTEEYDKTGKIRADKKIIRLILQNLLSNAVKYTQPKGQVSLKLGLKKAANRPKLIIEVADNGYGIPEEQHSKVFTKLFRGDNIVRLHTEGTGLGLYIVKSFVDITRGKISFKSKPGKGTTFYIEMPVQLPRP